MLSNRKNYEIDKYSQSSDEVQDTGEQTLEAGEQLGEGRIETGEQGCDFGRADELFQSSRDTLS